MFQRRKDNQAIAAAIERANTASTVAEEIAAISALGGLPLTTDSLDFLETVARESESSTANLAVEILLTHTDPSGVGIALAALADGRIETPGWGDLSTMPLACDRLAEHIDQAMPALEWGARQVLEKYKEDSFARVDPYDDFRQLLERIDAPQVRALDARMIAEAAKIDDAIDDALLGLRPDASTEYEVLFGETACTRLRDKPRSGDELPLFRAPDVAALADLPETLSACTFTWMHAVRAGALTDRVAQEWGAVLNAALASALERPLTKPPVLAPIAETGELVLYVFWAEPVSRDQVIAVAQAVEAASNGR